MPGPLTVAAHVVHQHDPAGGPFLISARRRQAIARQRLQTLENYSRLKKLHPTAEAARLAGSSMPTIWRWQKQFIARGLAGLLPRTARCGRPSLFKNVRLTAQAVRELELLHVEHSGSPRAAWQQFAKSPSCPPVMASYVRRTGRAPGPLAGIGRVSRVQARVLASTDQRRLFMKLPVRGVVMALIAVPPKFKLARVAK